MFLLFREQKLRRRLLEKAQLFLPSASAPEGGGEELHCGGGSDRCACSSAVDCDGQVRETLRRHRWTQAGETTCVIAVCARARTHADMSATVCSEVGAHLCAVCSLLLPFYGRRDQTQVARFVQQVPLPTKLCDWLTSTLIVTWGLGTKLRSVATALLSPCNIFHWFASEVRFLSQTGLNWILTQVLV